MKRKPIEKKIPPQLNQPLSLPLFAPRKKTFLTVDGDDFKLIVVPFQKKIKNTISPPPS